ncbi:MAG: hypothetical protein ACFCUV_19125 [Rivularia sp. (in: cyanobacteria)]
MMNDKVGDALNRALKYAQKAEGFASIMEKLQPHLAKIAVSTGLEFLYFRETLL